MENASKALLMAAGTLIGMLVLSLAVYLFTTFSGTATQISKENAKKQVDQFNSQFTSLDGKNVTIYDVVSTANLATENNIYYEFPTRSGVTNGEIDNYISVRLGNQLIEKGNDKPSENQRPNYEQLIKEDLNNMQTGPDGEPILPQYKCTTRISPTTRKSLLSDFYKK